MSRAEFHKIYEQMPKHFKAELIGGVVYVASPLKLQHAKDDSSLGSLFWNYAARTPGVETGHNATVILGDDGEPQPDVFLRIRPEFRGQSTTSATGYILGAPELLGEVALSSKSVDFHVKLDEYARYGAMEYLVMCVKEKKLRWFDLRTKEELLPDADGVYRVRAFPGLWINGEALFTENFCRALDTLDLVLTSPEHAAFVQRMGKAREKKKSRRSRG
jgi:hypothetical protein